MNLEQERRVFEIYEMVLEAPELERETLIRNQCRDDAELEQKVRACLEAAAMDAEISFEQRLLERIQVEARHAFEALHLDDAEQALIGRQVGPYKVLEVIGSGGAGVVYRARDSRLPRYVALKTLSNNTNNPDRLRRFKREAEVIASLNHPNIVTLHGVEELDGRPVLVMELVEGQTLNQKMAKHGIPLSDFYAIAFPLIEALLAAHEHGIIHRDLKPSNIMLHRQGQVKVLDFGLAKLEHEGENDSPIKYGTETLTARGAIMGTVAYMSPEQARGQELDSRTDLFSLGIILYEILAGHRPFQGDNTGDLISAIIRDQPRPVHEVNHSIPKRLSQLISRCLEKDPQHRYPNANELREAFLDLQKGSNNSTFFTGKNPSPLRWITSFQTTSLGFMGLVVTAFLIFWFFPNDEKGPGIEDAAKSFASGDPDKAIDLLEMAIDKNQDSALFYSRLSNYRSGSMSKAFEDAKIGYENRADLKDKDRYVVEGNYYMHCLQFKAALDRFEKASHLDKNDSFVFRQMANCHAALGNHGAELEMLQTARSLSLTVIHQGMISISLATNNDTRLALDEIARARDLFPDQAYPFWGEGFVRMVNGDITLARESFAQLARDKTFESWSILFETQLLMLEGRFDEIEGLFFDGLIADGRNDNPTNSVKRKLLQLRLHILLGNSAHADALLRDLLEIPQKDENTKPHRLRLLHQLALACAELGRIDIAQSILANLAELEAIYPSIISRAMGAHARGEVALGAGDQKQAKIELGAARQTWDDAWILFSWAKLMELEESYDKAAAQYKHIIEFEKGYIFRYYTPDLWILAHFRAAECYRKLDNRALARQYYQEFLDFWGHTAIPLVDTARNALNALAD